MKDYFSDFASMLVRDVLYNVLQQNINDFIVKDTKTSTVEMNLENILDNKIYYSEKDFLGSIEVKRNAKVRVFEVSDIDWKKAENDIFLSLNWADLRVGETTELEEIVRTLINLSSQDETLNWLNKLFLNNHKNALFLCALFHTLSHMEYEEVVPQGPTMAMAALNHIDDRVIGYAIKAFSNWNSKETLSYMKTTVPSIPWIKKEWERVIWHIEEFGDEVYELLNENDWADETMDTRTG